MNAYEQAEDKSTFFNAFFDKLAGGNSLRLSILEGKSEEEIRKAWSDELEAFKKMRNAYLIYE
jgi:uncharacterized protein YbbC (DUF1343 family)